MKISNNIEQYLNKHNSLHAVATLISFSGTTQTDCVPNSAKGEINRIASHGKHAAKFPLHLK